MTICHSLDDKTNEIMDLPAAIDYYVGMPERLERLLAAARAWCKAAPRGRQSELAAFLGVSRQAVSSWFAQNPKKQPTAEQALALQEFLRHRRQKGNDWHRPRQGDL
jgi:hypothetical protein